MGCQSLLKMITNFKNNIMKKCTKCNIEKELTEFSKMKLSKDGLQYKCKSCEKEYREQNKEHKKKLAKEWREQNKERLKERAKEYREQNKGRLKESRKEYYQQNKERIKEYYKQNKERFKERRKEGDKKYYQKNKERIIECVKEYREQNKERIKERKKEYYQKNKEYFREYKRKYKRERLKTDPLYKMSCNLRNRTWYAFKRKGYSKNSKTKEILGVDWEVCKSHIERQFTKGMSWDNYGEWHIDHIIPLASANTEQEIKKLCHYSNLQPLWAEDNLSKNDSINGQQIKFRI